MSYELDNDDVVDLGMYRGGNIKMALPCRGDFIQGLMRRAKCLWQQDILEWAFRYMPDNPNVVDVGSYTGSSAIWLAQMVKASVVAVEPDPFSYSLMTTNVSLNNLNDRIRAVNSAVWDSDGKSYMSIDSIDNHGAAQYRPCSSDSGLVVPRVRLDTLLAERDYKVDMLWIEMEGYENLAVAGALDTIGSDRPVIAVTAFSPAAKSLDPNYSCMQGNFKLLGALAKLGYTACGSKFNTTVFLPSSDGSR